MVVSLIPYRETRVGCGDGMKIVRIVPEISDEMWRIMKQTQDYTPRSDIQAYEITYKIRGNKHHKMTVFATNEVHAIAKAEQAWNTNQTVVALQKLARA